MKFIKWFFGLYDKHDPLLFSIKIDYSSFSKLWVTPYYTYNGGWTYYPIQVLGIDFSRIDNYKKLTDRTERTELAPTLKKEMDKTFKSYSDILKYEKQINGLLKKHNDSVTFCKEEKIKSFDKIIDQINKY